MFVWTCVCMCDCMYTVFLSTGYNSKQNLSNFLKKQNPGTGDIFSLIDWVLIYARFLNFLKFMFNLTDANN